MSDYPWYGLVEEEDMQQGDLLASCPLARFYMRVGLPVDIPAF